MLSPAEIATNQAYWHALEKQSLASLPELAKIAEGCRRSADAVRIAGYYSQMLDYWGTELQKAGTELKLPAARLLKDANDQFAEALRLNPNNIVARAQPTIQCAFARSAARRPAPQFVRSGRRSWQLGVRAIMLYGPADVPYLDIQIGRYFAQHGAYLQAAHLFQRCLELAPNDPAAELDLAKTYIDMGLVDAASASSRTSAQAIPDARNPLELVRVEALAYAKKNNFAQADKLLTEARSKNPKDAEFAGVMAEFYRLMGYSVLHESNGDAAREKDAAKWFQKSLAALDEQLQLLNAPMNVTAKRAGDSQTSTSRGRKCK